jgi:type IV secretory pathway VirB10-like protein
MADERDPKLSQHYRELESLEPPSALDQKILAAARAATESHAPLVVPAGRHRWYYSLAAAAVLMFAIAITLHIELDQPDNETRYAPTSALKLERELRGQIKQAPKVEPAPSAQPQPAPAPAFTPDPRAVAASPRADEPRMEAERLRAEQAAAEAKAAAEKRVLREETSRQRAASAAPSLAAAQERQSADVLARRDNAAAQRLAPAPAPTQIAAAPENPDRWLERIAEMRSRGRHADADRELAAFRKAYPNYQLSDIMRERVEGTPTPAAR